MSGLVSALSALKAVLDGLGLRWFLFGAQAAVVRGRPRMTADIDVTVEAADAEVPNLVRRLVAAGFEVRVEDVARTSSRALLFDPSSSADPAGTGQRRAARR